MAERSVNRAALVTGVFFIATGTLFLLERLGVLDVRLRVLLPIVLIVLGIAVLLGGRPRTPPAGT